MYVYVNAKYEIGIIIEEKGLKRGQNMLYVNKPSWISRYLTFYYHIIDFDINLSLNIIDIIVNKIRIAYDIIFDKL